MKILKLILEIFSLGCYSCFFFLNMHEREEKDESKTEREGEREREGRRERWGLERLERKRYIKFHY